MLVVSEKHDSYVNGGTMTDSPKGILETILVVDDNEDVLRTVVAILERAHFRMLSGAWPKSGPGHLWHVHVGKEQMNLAVRLFRKID
jgi:hypothetical protein